MTRALNLSSGLAAFVSLKNIWRPVEGQSGVKYYLPGDTVMVFLSIPPHNVFFSDMVNAGSLLESSPQFAVPSVFLAGVFL